MIFKHVLKEGINTARIKAGVFCCEIDLDFRLTESWGESKNDSKGDVPFLNESRAFFSV